MFFVFYWGFFFVQDLWWCINVKCFVFYMIYFVGFNIFGFEWLQKYFFIYVNLWFFQVFYINFDIWFWECGNFFSVDFNGIWICNFWEQGGQNVFFD